MVVLFLRNGRNSFHRKENHMEKSEIFKKLVDIVSPFAKDKDALSKVSDQMSILKDLKVNSARMVDIILKIENTFNIEVGDGDTDKVRTIGDAVNYIQSKSS